MSVSRRGASALLLGFAGSLLHGCGKPDASSADRDALAPRAGGLAPPGTAADEYWQVFARQVRERSGGRIDPVLLTRGEIGSDEQILQSLRRDRIQLAVNGAHAISSVVPEFAVLGLPYLFDSDDMAEYVGRTHLAVRLEPLLRVHGLRLLRLIPMGFHNVYSRRPIRTPSDLAGLRVRQPGDAASAAYAQALGLDLTPLPASEIVTALQTGLIQAGTTVTLNYLWSGIARDAPVLTFTRHAYLFNAVLANSAWWDDLRDRDRELIDDAFGSAADYVALMRAAETRDLAAAVARGEVQPVEPTAAELARWREPAEAVAERMIGELGSVARDLQAAIVAGRADWARRAREARTP